MLKRYGLLLLIVVAIAWFAVTAAGQPKGEKPAHSRFHRDFAPEDMVAFCQGSFRFVKEKCSTGSRGLGIQWKGEESTEDFKTFHLVGELADDEVKQVLEALRPELVKLARASKVVLVHDLKDSIVDRPMRLLQPGLLPGGALVKPSGIRGFYFTYKEGKIEGAVDVLAIPALEEKKLKWLILGTLHEVAR